MTVVCCRAANIIWVASYSYLSYLACLKAHHDHVRCVLNKTNYAHLNRGSVNVTHYATVQCADGNVFIMYSGTNLPESELSSFSL